MKTKLLKTAVFISMFAFMSSFQTIRAQEMKTEEPVSRTPGYGVAIGLRAGETSGLTYKQRLGNRHAGEFILGMFPHALSFTALFERYHNSATNNLSWYYGAGGHFTTSVVRGYGYYVYDDWGRYYYYRSTAYGAGIGIDGILGLEYKIYNAPFAFSLDLKPYMEMTTTGHMFMSVDPGLGIKVTF